MLRVRGEGLEYSTAIFVGGYGEDNGPLLVQLGNLGSAVFVMGYIDKDGRGVHDLLHATGPAGMFQSLLDNPGSNIGELCLDALGNAGSGGGVLGLVGTV